MARGDKMSGGKGRDERRETGTETELEGDR